MREIVRVAVQAVAMGVRGRRFGVLLVLIGAVIAVVVAAATTAVAPVVVYPFL